jgi:hypothetical protein
MTAVDWDDEPDAEEPPGSDAPRKRKSNRFARARPREAPAPLAPFLLDPSLLPKRPPGGKP